MPGEPESCIRPPKLWRDEGSRVYDAITSRSKQDPWFAAASGVMQQGGVTYALQQPYVERVTRLGYQGVLAKGPLGTRDFIRGAQMSNNIGRQLYEAAVCYQAHCSNDECVRDPQERQLMRQCLLSLGVVETLTQVPGEPRRELRPHGVGRKPTTLFALYAGNPDAVPVDRHVARAVKENWPQDWDAIKMKPSERSLDRSPEEATQAGIERIVRREARKCGMIPARYMVGLWIRGVCNASSATGQQGNVQIEGNTYTDCRSLRARDQGTTTIDFFRGRSEPRRA